MAMSDAMVAPTEKGQGTPKVVVVIEAPGARRRLPAASGDGVRTPAPTVAAQR
jgi:hypothetical protein